jgi:hypothetical protein
MTIPRDWKEFLLALRSENTRFLLIGAHALAFHAEARLTGDLGRHIRCAASSVHTGAIAGRVNRVM